MGAAGLALSTSLCSYLQVGILLKGLVKKFGRKIFDGVIIELVKTIVNTSVMFVITFFIFNLTYSLPQVVQLLAAVFVAAFLYLAGAVLLKVEMLSLITGRKLLK
jgi:peptidoglycan biosynthesis protein MviN/MurJ (putative lipid II flippase)